MSRSLFRSDVFWKLWLPSILLTVVGLAVAFRMVRPSPPRTLVVGTGSVEGAYHRHGLALRDAMRDDGLDIELRPSAGSKENLARLKSGDVDFAFVQSGVARPDEVEGLAGLASLYHEPLWVFHRSGLPLNVLGDLAAHPEWVLEIGDEGSGTRAVVEPLLRACGCTELPATGSSAADAATRLLAGSLDVLCVVAGADAPIVRQLAVEQRDHVTLLDFERSLAVSRRFPFLQRVRLGRGGLDLSLDVPAQDVSLVAPTATWVAHEELHPALISLLLGHAERRYGRGGTFADPGVFPSPHHVDVPLSAAASRYFKSGPSFLFKMLPFWIAATVERLLLLALPLVTLLFPLFKLAPPLVRWRVRSKIYRWYRLLRAIEAEFVDETSSGLVLHQRLDGVEAEVRTVAVPLSYAKELYHLRLHLDFVRGRLGRRETPPGNADLPSTD